MKNRLKKVLVMWKVLMTGSLIAIFCCVSVFASEKVPAGEADGRTEEIAAENGTEDIAAQSQDGGILWRIDSEGTLYLSGTGSIEDETDVPAWITYSDDIKKAVVSVSAVPSMNHWFNECDGLTEIDFSNADLSMTTDIGDMVEGCVSLKELDLSGFPADKMTNGEFAYSISSISKNMRIIVPANFRYSKPDDVFKEHPVELYGVWKDQDGNFTPIIQSGVDKEMIYTECKGEDLIPLENATDGDLSFSISEDGLLTITGNGDYKDAYWTHFTPYVKNVKVNVSGITSTADMFSYMYYIESVDIAGLDTSNTTDMSYMFSCLYFLTEIDMSGCDTSKVTDFSGMFAVCHSLSEIDLSKNSFESVTSENGLSKMFYSCASLRRIDLPKKSAKIRSIYQMFDTCISLGKIDLSGLDLDEDCDMRRAFSQCIEAAEIIFPKAVLQHPKTEDMLPSYSNPYYLKLDLSEVTLGEDVNLICHENDYGLVLLGAVKWPANAKTVISLDGKWQDEKGNLVTETQKDLTEPMMYTKIREEAEKPVPVVAATISGTAKNGLSWSLDPEGTLTISGTMQNVSAAGDNDDEEGEYDEEPWYPYREYVKKAKVSITNATYIVGFAGYGNMEEVDLSGTDLTNVKSIFRSFADCSKLKKINWGKTRLDNIENIEMSFFGCSALQELDTTVFNTSKVTDLDNVFSGCASLKAIDVSTWDTSKVITMDQTFAGCRSIEELDLSNMNTDSLIHVSGTFGNCSSLKKLDLSHFKWDYGYNAGYMFNGCSNLEVLILPQNIKCGLYYYTSPMNSTFTNDMSYLFHNCKKLKHIDISSWEFVYWENDRVPFMNTITGCDGLESFTIPKDTPGVIELPTVEGYYWVDKNGETVKTTKRFPGENNTYIRVVAGADPDAHEWDTFYTDDIPATCLQDGKKSIHCSHCGLTKNETVIPAKGHAWGEWKTITPASDLADGIKEHKCSHCGKTETEVIKKTNGSKAQDPGDGSTKETPGDVQAGSSPTDNGNTASGDSSANTPEKTKAGTLAAVSGVKTKVKKNQVTLSWKKAKANADGYEVQYAQNQKFSKGKKTKKIKKAKTTTLTVKKLKKGKTYYFRIRTYHMEGKKKVYGKWSKIKKVKIKK
ncbi:MAG: DUF285 domain-containing protein [Lachnospiraceae bacterium]|nr:DUF285 domain-containing protein [Lachnospiraceae bacterium]